MSAPPDHEVDVDSDEDDEEPEEVTARFSLEDLLRDAGHEERQLSAALVCLTGPSLGKVFSLRDGPNVIGRAPMVEIQIPDDGVSRWHATIVGNGQTYSLEDMGSKNGTLCNGTKLTRPVTLREGDRIRLSPNTMLRFEFQDELEEKMREKLYDLATRDPLTQAYNRRYFSEHLASEWAWSQRHNKPCALLTVDVDHFKKVNDQHGHPAGDYVLKRLVHVVQRTIRREDLFARVGGEEFALLSRATYRQDAFTIGERLRVAVSQCTFVWQKDRIYVTVSVGVATSLDEGITTPDELISKADEMLYEAKNAGRNRVVIAGQPKTG